MWRVVMRPLLLRPPVFGLASTRRFSGFFFVISSKSGRSLKRFVGVSGLKDLSPMAWLWLREFDLLTRRQGDDGLLPVTGAPGVLRPAAAEFAADVDGVHTDHLLLEELLDGLSDLHLVGGQLYAEYVLISLLGEDAGLLGEMDVLDDVERLVHLL